MKFYLGPYINESNIESFSYWRAPDGVLSAIDLRANKSVAGVGCFAVPDASVLSSDYRLFGQGDIRNFVPRESDRSIFASMLGLLTVQGSLFCEWLWDVLTVQADPFGLLRVRPLMPTSKRQMELWLGPLARSRLFQLADLEAVPVILKMRDDYRRIRQDSLDGKMILGASPDPEFYRRVLDMWGEKFRINNPEDVFIPDDLPKETRLTHSTTITDNFNRADSAALGTSAEGWTWTEFGGSALSITTNEVTYGGDDTPARANSDLASDDHYSQAVVAGLNSGSTSNWELQVRFASAAATYYRLIHRRNATTTYRLFTDTTQVGATVDAAEDTPPYTMRLEMDGSSILAKKSGTTVIGPFTDVTYSGQLRCGMGSTGANVGQKHDNFEAGDLAAAAGRMLIHPGVRGGMDEMLGGMNG